MSGWSWAAIGLMPPLLVAIDACGRGQVVQRLVGLQLMTGITLSMLTVLSFAFDQSSSTDLALTFGLLALPASLAFAVFIERWL